jgi:hypothetical protein
MKCVVVVAVTESTTASVRSLSMTSGDDSLVRNETTDSSIQNTTSSSAELWQTTISSNSETAVESPENLTTVQPTDSSNGIAFVTPTSMTSLLLDSTVPLTSIPDVATTSPSSLTSTIFEVNMLKRFIDTGTDVSEVMTNVKVT